MGRLEKGGVLASIDVRTTFIEDIKSTQFKDENLNELKKKIVIGEEKETTIMRKVCSILNERFVFLQLMTWFKNI